MDEITRAAIQKIIESLPAKRPVDTLATFELTNGTQGSHLSKSQVDMVTYAAIKEFELRKQLEAVLQAEMTK